jgi:hypothetical protein
MTAAIIAIMTITAEDITDKLSNNPYHISILACNEYNCYLSLTILFYDPIIPGILIGVL